LFRGTSRQNKFKVIDAKLFVLGEKDKNNKMKNKLDQRHKNATTIEYGGH